MYMFTNNYSLNLHLSSCKCHEQPKFLLQQHNFGTHSIPLKFQWVLMVIMQWEFSPGIYPNAGVLIT